MGKAGTLEKQMMAAFKEKEEQEVAINNAELQQAQQAEVEKQIAKIRNRHEQKFNKAWRKKKKQRKNAAKESRRKNR